MLQENTYIPTRVQQHKDIRPNKSTTTQRHTSQQEYNNTKTSVPTLLQTINNRQLMFILNTTNM